MTNPDADRDVDPTVVGSTAVQAPRRRRPWWVLAVLAVLLVLALILLVSRCGSGTTDQNAGGAASTTAAGATDAGAANGSASAAATSAAGAGLSTANSAGSPTGDAAGSTAAPNGTAGAGAGTGGGANTLTAGGAALLPVAAVSGPGGTLAALVGKPAAATGVLVQSVPANEGFWVGTSATDRVWVQLSGSGESGYQVKPGDRVAFSGQVVAHDAGFAGQVGVDAAEGAAQLTAQAAHIEVAKNAVRLGTS